MSAQAAYEFGYLDRLNGQAARRDLGAEQRYYDEGYADAGAGRPRQQAQAPYGGQVPPVPPAPPAPAPAPPYGGPQAPAWNLDPGIGYELLARVGPFAVPLNIARAAEQLIPGLVRYALLGDRPGDSERGFRLSGPAGAVLQAGRASGYPPAALGLPAYIGARIFGGAGLQLIDAQLAADLLGGPLRYVAGSESGTVYSPAPPAYPQDPGQDVPPVLQGNNNAPPQPQRRP